MKDLIERYLAERRIDEALSRVFTKNSDSIGKQILDRIPSAQPEIIRCKDCEYWREDHTCREHSLVSPMAANEFCSRAERREE